MTPKRQRFVEEYAIDLNATQAAIRAGYSEHTAKSQGQRLLTFVDVQQALAEKRTVLASSLHVSAETVLREYARVAFTQLRDTARWTEDGMSLTPSAELSDDASAAIKEVRVVKTITRGKDDYEQERIEQRVVLHDKGRALHDLADHLGMLSAGRDTPIDARSLHLHLPEGTTIEDLRALRDGLKDG